MLIEPSDMYNNNVKLKKNRNMCIMLAGTATETCGVLRVGLKGYVYLCMYTWTPFCKAKIEWKENWKDLNYQCHNPYHAQHHQHIMAHARFTKSHISRVSKMNIHVWLFLIRKTKYVLMVWCSCSMDLTVFIIIRMSNAEQFSSKSKMVRNRNRSHVCVFS